MGLLHIATMGKTHEEQQQLFSAIDIGVRMWNRKILNFSCLKILMRQISLLKIILAHI